MNYQLFISRGIKWILQPYFRIATSSSKPTVTQETELVYQLRQTISKTCGEYARSTRENYITAVNALEKFLTQSMPRKLLTPETLTAGQVKSFELWMLDGGHNPNYVAQIMSSLRAVINRINNQGKELFARVRTSPYPTAKRAVDEETIKRMENLKLSVSSGIAQARDIFMVCFLGMGIPLIDAVYLQKKQLKDGIITYFRHKTRIMVRVKVADELQEIINRISPVDSDYLLPILHGNDEQQHKQQYRRFYQKYMRELKKLSAMMQLESNLTSYTPRHSWASIAHKKGIYINVISQALGHSNTKTTSIYIKEIENEQLEQANKIVISAIKSQK